MGEEPGQRAQACHRADGLLSRPSLIVHLVRAPEHQYRFALRPGDWVLHDDHRMLHARTGFRGARWVRGVHFDAR